MVVTREVHYRDDFEFWSGAFDNVRTMPDSDVDKVIAFLDSTYDSMTETEFNDFFRFEEDYIAEILGYADWETYQKELRGEDDE